MRFDLLKSRNDSVWLFNTVVHDRSVSCGLATFVFKQLKPIDLYDQHNNKVCTIKPTEEIKTIKTGINYHDPLDSIVFEKL